MEVEQQGRCPGFGGLLAILHEFQIADWWRERLLLLADRSPIVEETRTKWVAEIERCIDEACNQFTTKEVMGIWRTEPISYANFDEPCFINLILTAAENLRDILTIENMVGTDFHFLKDRLLALDTYRLGVGLGMEIQVIEVNRHEEQQGRLREQEISLPEKLAERFPNSKQARLIVQELAKRLGRWVPWSELPDDAFQAKNNRLPDAVMKALKRIRDHFNDAADYELSISEIEQTVKLTRTNSPDK